MSSPVTATSHTEFLVSRGAVMAESGQSAVHFGDPATEFEAFEHSAALLDRTGAACLIQEGEDALDLLHRLSTNDLISLHPGDARFTVLTSERGRIIDMLHVVNLGQNRLLLLSESPDAQKTVDWIEKFTIIEDSVVRDASLEFARFALIGPTALQVAASASGIELVRGKVALTSDGEDQTILVASEWANTERVDIAVPRAELEAAWRKLTEAGAVPAGDISFQAARINNDVPTAGNELTEDSNPLEVRLKDLISFTKGCYVGQEVVARLDTYDKLQKRLVGFEIESTLSAGTKLSSDGKRAGAVTSVSALPSNGNSVALGFARRDFWTDGTVLEFDGGTVTVRELSEDSPFS